MSHLAGYEAPIHRALAEPILLGGAPRGPPIGNGTNPTTRQLLDCAKVDHPKTFSGFSVLSVVSLDVNASD